VTVTVTNQKQTKNQPQETQQTQTQETPKEWEIARKVLSRVKSQANGDSWVSERLVEGDNVVVTASSLDGRTITLWIKPSTLRNGYPILLDEGLEQRLNELEETIQVLKKMLPVLKEFTTQRGKKTTYEPTDRIIIRRKY
jgi:hypothetical protein